MFITSEFSFFYLHSVITQTLSYLNGFICLFWTSTSIENIDVTNRNIFIFVLVLISYYIVSRHWPSDDCNMEIYEIYDQRSFKMKI